MDPRLTQIMEANTRLLRHEADFADAQLMASLRAELDEQCERALADLVPAAGAGGGQQRVPEVATFIRYLLRNMDLRERVDMLGRAAEVSQFLAHSARARQHHLRTTAAIPGAGDHVASQLPVVLARLGWIE